MPTQSNVNPRAEAVDLETVFGLETLYGYTQKMKTSALESDQEATTTPTSDRPEPLVTLGLE